jgi:predicted acyl esterase
LALGDEVHYLAVRDKVPDPKDIFFSVQYPGKPPIRLAGHFWYNAETVSAGKKCPAIVEFVPYRRRDGTMIADSKMYPWFAFNDYLCFRIDLQGSGDSEGVLTDEYTDEELTYCSQVIAEIAALPSCDGNVGMMGKSWSAINSLMVAARPDRPRALKAVLVCCGSDDRYNDDVHYMGGAMMFDNVSWPSSMFGWMSLPPDPAVVGDPWKEMWRADQERRLLVQAMGDAPAARRLLGREQRARPFRGRAGPGVRDVGMAGRL